MSLSHCIHQTLNSKASTRFHSGGLQQSCTLLLNTFLFGVIILIANLLKRAFSSQLAAKLPHRLLVLYHPFPVPFGPAVRRLLNITPAVPLVAFCTATPSPSTHLHAPLTPPRRVLSRHTA